MLSSENLELLAHTLQVPAILTDILDGKGEWTDDVKMGLHEAISDMQPDTALLAIAMGARKIAAIYGNASPSTKVMELECCRIIHDYGSIWLSNAQDYDVDIDEVYDVLIHTAEDLEGLSDLLELNFSFLKAKDEQAAKICELLYIQARAHAMIADTFMKTAEEAIVQTQAGFTAVPQVETDNVIPFPLQNA